ncbi:hypothetical protein RR49_00237 [Microbacterium ginsengisoli]|uniref:Uncharacterized protein n=1 Tax=Microbacterium ginsengisoli TaxID=400772 RepID=A0A0F0LXM6_9MICO|nr:hypothetical protein RR49_00237 [Microbacterium ginsengisoli]
MRSRDGHGAGGDGAGLVQHDGVDAAGLLQHLGSADQDAQLRAPPGADKQRGRRRQPERARARDDQRRHRGGERDLRGSPDQKPHRERDDGEGDDDGDEDRGDPVGEALHLRLPGLRLLHQPGHPGQLRVRADPGELHQQPAAGVHRRADHLRAGGDFDGDGLAGQHRLVHRGDTLGDDTVGGDLLPRPHHHDVAGHQLGDRDALLDTRAEDDGVFRAQLQQGAQSLPGLPLRAGLQVAAEEDEHRHQCGDLQIHLVTAGLRGADEGHAHPHPGHPGTAEEQGIQGPAERSQHAEADQGVHRRRTVTGVDRRGTVERPRPPHHDRGRQGQGQPLPVGELQRRDHRQHRHRHRQDRRDDQPLPQRHQLRILRRGLLVGGVDGWGGDGCPVPGLLDRRDQLLHRHRGLGVHAGLLGGEVDRRRHPGQLVQLPLHPGRARRAGHPGDVEIDIRRRRGHDAEARL